MPIILCSQFNDCADKVAPYLQGKVQRALCITTAANPYVPEKRDWQMREMDAVRSLGIELECLDLAATSPAEIQQKLANHTAVYITGGNTFYLLEHMNSSGFREAFSAWWDDTKTYIGCSAGAVVVCPRIDYIAPMDDPSQADLTDFTGLGLCPMLIVPHADNAKYGKIGQEIIVKHPDTEGYLALDDDQAWVADLAGQRVL